MLSTRSSLMAVALSLAAAMPARAEAPRPKKEELIGMKVREVRRHRSGAYAVILQSPDRGQVLPIWIARREAQAIQMRLSTSSMPRPLTHELLEPAKKTTL